jgi:4-hydroxy-tetrahydrodipicolinate reductase
MGQALAVSIEARPDLQLVGLWRRGQDLAPLLAAADLVIDFSLPSGTAEVLRAATAAGKPLVCGVSGLGDAAMAELDEAACSIPLIYDRNMSPGIAVLQRSVREAAASLGADYDITIAEVHHMHKKDAPSGTALQLAEAIAEAREGSGMDSIKFDVERRGEVPGDHEVTLRTASETLGFSHSVSSRQVFVDGALHAAVWLVGQAPGRYSMHDVLFGERK